ncbi:MAG: DUF4185 domain-containing protein [Candidatus Bathyarchaeota archaeon]|jgi:hypothetical protein
MNQDAMSIKETKLVGTLFKKNSVRVLGHDGAYSVPLDNGEVFWSFGDTLIGNERRGYAPERINIDDWLTKDAWVKENILMTSNSALIAEVDDIRKLMETGFEYYTHERIVKKEKFIEAREIIPVPDELQGGERRTAFWPMDGVDIDGRLYVYYLMVKGEPMALYGTGVVKSVQPYEEFERLYSLVRFSPKEILDATETPFVWWNNLYGEKGQKMPNFGTAVLKKAINGYIYVYGSKVDKTKDEMVHVVTLARVRKGDVEDVTKYEYLIESPSEQNASAPVWGENPMDSTGIFEGNANELSVSYNPYLDKYLAVYSTAQIDSPEIHMRVSENPVGPWSDPIQVFKPRRSCDVDFCYAAKEHPEYSGEHGKKIYLTYVSHQRYFPELLQVEFE